MLEDGHILTSVPNCGVLLFMPPTSAVMARSSFAGHSIRPGRRGDDGNDDDGGGGGGEDEDDGDDKRARDDNDGGGSCDRYPWTRTSPDDREGAILNDAPHPFEAPQLRCRHRSYCRPLLRSLHRGWQQRGEVAVIVGHACVVATDASHCRRAPPRPPQHHSRVDEPSSSAGEDGQEGGWRTVKG